MEGCVLASAVLTTEIHFTSKVNTVSASGEDDRLWQPVWRGSICSTTGGKASARMALREQQASCTRQNWHRRLFSKPNLKLAKPERTPVLSNPAVPGITDPGKVPRKRLFAGGSSAGEAMQQPSCTPLLLFKYLGYYYYYYFNLRCLFTSGYRGRKTS